MTPPLDLDGYLMGSCTAEKRGKPQGGSSVPGEETLYLHIKTQELTKDILIPTENTTFLLKINSLDTPWGTSDIQGGDLLVLQCLGGVVDLGW